MRKEFQPHGESAKGQSIDEVAEKVGTVRPSRTAEKRIQEGEDWPTDRSQQGSSLVYREILLEIWALVLSPYLATRIYNFHCMRSCEDEELQKLLQIEVRTKWRLINRPGPGTKHEHKI